MRLDNVTSQTLLKRAEIVPSAIDGASVRTKITPVSAAAGNRVIVVSAPEWTPTPEQDTGVKIVD